MPASDSNSRGPAAGLRAFCIGHRPPLYLLPPGVVFVAEQDCGVPGAWIYPETYPDLMPGDSASEYPALFAIRRRLESEGFGGHVLLTQYRKFVTHADIGVVEPDFPYLKLVPPEALPALPLEALLPRPGQDWLLSGPMTCADGAGQQYASCHIARDLLRFLADAVDAGAIDDRKAMGTVSLRTLLVSPTLGVYPARAFFDVFGRLERAATAFLDGGYRPRDGYQRLVVGFCLERLNSFLVAGQLVAAKANAAAAFGAVTIVAPGGQLTRTE